MVDSFKFLPYSIGALYKMTERKPAYPIPWAPLTKPLAECTFALVTTGGLYVKGVQEAFDEEGERQNPTWGDPTYRVIAADTPLEQIGVSHLHINTANIEADPNTVLPITHFQALAEAGEIGALAPDAYSFMGFQGLPYNTTEWEQTYGPEVIARMKAQNVDCVLLTPT
ncbi:MAG: glycine/sarcosine/betaine reductase selenoprotein B family protein [Ardenticatenaceae bacterium]